MRVLVCGGRDFSDRGALTAPLGQASSRSKDHGIEQERFLYTPRVVAGREKERAMDGRQKSSSASNHCQSEDLPGAGQAGGTAALGVCLIALYRRRLG